MESGRPLKSDRSARARASRPFVLAALLCLSVLSCSPPARVWQARLEAIDAVLAAPQDGALKASPAWAFRRALAKAKTPVQWLSLLKRARLSELAGDEGRYALVARQALAKAGPDKEVGLAAADALLLAGEPLAVLELFKSRLSLEEKPRLWARAYFDALKAGILPPGLESPANLGRLGDILGEGRFYVDAAALCLAARDVLGARAWLSRASAASVPVPPELLWDAGLYGILAQPVQGKSSPGWQRLSADSAWLLGRRDQAIATWQGAVAADPLGSYRTWASLAVATGEGLGPPAVGSSFDSKGNLGPGLEERAVKRGSPKNFRGYYEGMLIRFPKAEGARILYGGALAREDRLSEAAAILEASPAPADPRVALDRLRVGSAVWMGKRLPVEALKAADAHPREPALFDAALAVLLEGGDYEGFLMLLDRAGEAGVQPLRKDLFAAFAGLLRGDRAGAEEAFRLALQASPGPEAAFALGALALARVDFAEAQASYDRALSLARSPQEKCLVLKAQGRLADRLGDLAGARSLYLGASQADPSDAEAWRLAHR